jgi:hypothetical protein
MEVELVNKACYRKDCNVFDFLSEKVNLPGIEKEVEKSDILIVEKSGDVLSVEKKDLLMKEEAARSEASKIRTPDTNIESDGNMEHLGDGKKWSDSIDVIFDVNIISKELAGVAVSVISWILKDSREKGGFVKTVKTDEEDKVLYDRLWAFLSDSQRIIRLRESEMIQGLILLEKVYEKHGSGNDFHSSFVDLIFYLATCLLLAHKFSSDSPITNEEWCNIGNMSLSTINACEAHTLWLLKYELWIDIKDVEHFMNRHGYKSHTLQPLKQFNLG